MTNRYALTICAVLAACEREPAPVTVDGGVDGESGNTMQILAGDGQTIAQHAASESLVARIVDALGNGVPGIPVEFDAAPGSAFRFSVSTQTNMDGVASASAYVHAAGQLQVVARAPDVASVTYTLQVTPSPHTYDGVYDCGDPTNAQFSIKSILIAEGSVSLPNQLRDPISTALDEASGTLDIEHQISEGNFMKVSGVLEVDAWQEATGSGSYFVRVFTNSSYPSEPSGGWTCARR